MQNREDFQVLPEDIHLVVQVHLEVLEGQELLGDKMVIQQDRQDFQDVQAGLSQVGSSRAFHRVKDLLMDIPADDRRFHFQAVNQQEDQERVKSHRVNQVDDQKAFRRDQVVDILVAGLVDKHQAGFKMDKGLLDIQAGDPVKGNQKVLDILVGGRVDKDRVEDIPADKLLEVIPVEHRNLVALEVDILVEGQELAILEVLKDLAVVQVLRDQVDIQDRELLEVSKAQVDHLPAAILALNQKRKDQEVSRVVRAHNNQDAIQAH